MRRLDAWYYKPRSIPNSYGGTGFQPVDYLIADWKPTPDGRFWNAENITEQR